MNRKKHVYYRKTNPAKFGLTWNFPASYFWRRRGTELPPGITKRLLEVQPSTQTTSIMLKMCECITLCNCVQFQNAKIRMRNNKKSVQLSGVALPSVLSWSYQSLFTLIKAKGHKKTLLCLLGSPELLGQGNYAFPVYLFKLQVVSKQAAQIHHPHTLVLSSFQY